MNPRRALLMPPLLLLAGCVAMIPETFTVTPGASTSQEIASGKRIYTEGATVSFTWRIPRPGETTHPGPLATPFPRPPSGSVVPVRGTSEFYPPPGDSWPAAAKK